MQADLSKPSEIISLLSASAIKAQTTKEGSSPWVIVPEGYKIESIEHLLKHPSFRTETFTTEDYDSFCAYLLRYGTTETVICYKDDDLILAIIDYHNAAPPSLNGKSAFTALLKVSPPKKRDAIMDQLKTLNFPIFKGTIKPESNE